MESWKDTRVSLSFIRGFPLYSKMKQINQVQKAIDYLEKVWPKGHKERGEAMVLLALAQMGGREEGKMLSEFIKTTNNNTHGQSPIIPDGQSKTERVGRLVSGQRSTKSRAVTRETLRGSQNVHNTNNNSQQPEVIACQGGGEHTGVTQGYSESGTSDEYPPVDISSNLNNTSEKNGS